MGTSNTFFLIQRNSETDTVGEAFISVWKAHSRVCVWGGGDAVTECVLDPAASGTLWHR